MTLIRLWSTYCGKQLLVLIIRLKINMKKIIVVFSLLVFSQISFGQTGFSFNQGGSKLNDYFSTIPYENINEKIIVSVKINEKVYRFILDTGAPTTISSKLFNELNPDLITKIPISDANQVKDSLSVVRLKDIAIGDIVFTNIPTLVAKDNIIFECFQVDGFIGSNLLRNSVVQLNNSTKYLIITNDEKKLALSTKHSSDLFLDKQSSPVISIYLKKKKKAKEQLLFDLGMNGLYDLSLNHFNIFSKYNIFEIIGISKGSNSLGLFQVAKDTIQYRLRLPEMEINGVKILNISTQTTIDDNSRIGCRILEYGIVTIDYKNKKFYFSPFLKNEIEATENKFPIDVVARNNQLYIGFIWDNKLYDNLSVGDQIIAIDGISYENLNTCALIIKGSVFKDKNKVNLTTRNIKGEKFETMIERK